MKILIVDDSRAMRMIVKRTLRQAGFSGHDVQEAENGVEGLKVVEEFDPELILSDYNMPEMNGGEFLQKLRENGNQVTFGFITSESNTNNRQMAQDGGAAFVLTKPFSPDSFADQLESILG